MERAQGGQRQRVRPEVAGPMTSFAPCPRVHSPKRPDYSIASSAVASNLAFGFALDEISHHNQFREIRDSDNVCLSLPNQENGDSKY
jgi:hypothetical protein